MSGQAGPVACVGGELTAAEVIAGHDLSGSETIVTGGYAGLGYQTAKALATRSCSGRRICGHRGS